MKIVCPKCNSNGTIPDHEIPESGRFISCPRCNEGFTITKPRAGNDGYLVDTCPSCSFSTFGDETFSICPKCGIAVKTFVDRQREEQRLKHNLQLLEKKVHNTETVPLPSEAITTPVADFIDNLHPVNLISFGAAAVAIFFLVVGLWGIIEYDSSSIQARLTEEGEEQISGLYVFLHYGLQHAVKLLYGIWAMAVTIQFMKRLKMGLRGMNVLISVSIALVPLMYIIGFINWVLAPIPHTISGYTIEILNIIFMSTLVGVPLYLLLRFLSERKITSVVKL